MVKYIILILLFLTGCSDKELRVDNKYIEETITYEVGESKVIKEEIKEKDAYDEKVLSGKTTGWSSKTRYEVGYGKDIEPGFYNILSRAGGYDYIFMGAIEVEINNWDNKYYLDPTENAVCYANEQDCFLDYVKRVEGVTLREGDKIFVSHPRYQSQYSYIKFEAQYITVHHDAVSASPEVRVESLKVKESVRKYNNIYKCYINDYEVFDCSTLKYYNELEEKLDS